MDSLFALPALPEARTAPPGEYAHTRRRDPETSKEAAVVASKNLTDKQDQVLSVLRAYGPSSDEGIIETIGYLDMSDWPKQSPSGIRTRRSELVAKGLVEHCGFGVTQAGNRTRLWRATNDA